VELGGLNPTSATNLQMPENPMGKTNGIISLLNSGYMLSDGRR
jgi:hypothetical protein